jgi:hypothetical protein
MGNSAPLSAVNAAISASRLIWIGSVMFLLFWLSIYVLYEVSSGVTTLRRNRPELSGPLILWLRPSLSARAEGGSCGQLHAC